MHVDVSLQLAQLAVSVLTGFALGVLYDVLRAMRRVFKINAALDALYCAVLLLALFTLGMDIGQGGVHVFMCRMRGVYVASEPRSAAAF